MADHNLLRALSEAPGAPGHEDEIRQLFLREVGDFGELESDGHGSVVLELPPAGCAQGHDDHGAPRVMLTAHMDEVGFMVQAINADGAIQVVPLGGWWTHTLLAQRMTLITRSGQKIPGVFAATPVHHLGADRNQVIPIERLLFDLGASSRVAVETLGVGPGDVLVPQVAYQQLAIEHRWMGKALDNRVGMGCLIETTRRLRAKPTPNCALITATVQEEVGTRGAATATALASPDVALVLEGPPADDLPLGDPGTAQGVLGRGVQIRLLDPTAISSRRLIDLTLKLAKEHEIPHQLTVRRSGGTDAKAIHLSEVGIPTIVLGVPCRYIHSHNAIFDERDYDAMIDLAEALMQALDSETVEGLLDFLGSEAN